MIFKTSAPHSRQSSREASHTPPSYMYSQGGSYGHSQGGGWEQLQQPPQVTQLQQQSAYRPSSQENSFPLSQTSHQSQSIPVVQPFYVQPTTSSWRGSQTMVPANSISNKVKSDEIVQSVRHKELMGAIESLRIEITHLKTQQAELTSRITSLEGRMSGVKDNNMNTLLFEELSKLRKDLTTFHIQASCPQIASLELNNSSLTTVDNDETMSAYDENSPSVSEKDDCFVEMSITDYMKHKKASITLIDKTSCHSMKSTTRVQTSSYDFTMLFEEHEVIRKL